MTGCHETFEGLSCPARFKLRRLSSIRTIFGGVLSSVTLNLSKIVQHLWESIISENTELLVPVFDLERPIISTGDMRTWYTGKPCEYTRRSHVNFCVYDSTWESADAFQLDHGGNVDAWVKNDHLGFEVLYVFKGVVHKYRPDFIIRLKTGSYLVLETKGQDTDQDKTKRTFLDEWINAVNEHGGFGKWGSAVSRRPGDVMGILEETLLRRSMTGGTGHKL